MKRRTGYVYDLIFAQHTLAGHPECAERLAAILDELETSGLLADVFRVKADEFSCTNGLRALVPIDLYKE